jgi:hypothetical protein
MNIGRILSAAALVAAAGLEASPSPARGQSWEVEGRLLKADGEKADDLSGIACATASGFPRDCLVIDDETQWAQWVRLEDGRLVAGDTLPLIDETFGGDDLELDGEGVAFADGAFYVVGSHGAPRSEAGMDPDRRLARLRADSHLLRIEPKGSGFRVDDSLALVPVILTQPDLRDHAARPLEENGVTIEGLAALGDDLFIGFRGPVLGDGDQAAVLQVDAGSLFGRRADAGKLHLLGLGAARGVRDLAAFGDEILVLAGPGPEQAGAYSIFRWSPDDGASVRFLADVPCAEDQSGKPEAILPLDASGQKLRLLLMTDGPNEGDPYVCSLPWDS